MKLLQFPRQQPATEYRPGWEHFAISEEGGKILRDLIGGRSPKQIARSLHFTEAEVLDHVIDIFVRNEKYRRLLAACVWLEIIPEATRREQQK